MNNGYIYPQNLYQSLSPTLSQCSLHLFFHLNLSSDLSGTHSLPFSHFLIPSAHIQVLLHNSIHPTFASIASPSHPAFTFLLSLQHLDSNPTSSPLPAAHPFNPSIQFLPHSPPLSFFLGSFESLFMSIHSSSLNVCIPFGGLTHNTHQPFHSLLTFYICFLSFHLSSIFCWHLPTIPKCSSQCILFFIQSLVSYIKVFMMVQHFQLAVMACHVTMATTETTVILENRQINEEKPYWSNISVKVKRSCLE